MIFARLGAVAIATLALVPTTVLAAPGTSDLELRAVLTEPGEGGYVEYPVGTSGSLEGRFDAKTYAAYYESSTAERNGIEVALKSAGFATGYDRDWYQSATLRQLGELVMVFMSADGASEVAHSSRGSYEADSGFQGYVGLTAIPEAYALHINQSGLLWTVVIFQKGNAMYGLVAGAPHDYQEAMALAQARAIYTNAPDAFRITDTRTTELAGIFSLTPYLRLMAIGVFVGALVSGAVLAILVYVIFRPRPNPVATVSKQ